MYDLKIFPIHTREGKPAPYSAGLHAAGPPRRSTRSRSEDLLILSLTLRENNANSPKSQQSWLEALAQDFFKTSGSVTAALRSLVETLNLSLLEKNLKNKPAGGSAIAAINVGAVHHRQLYIVQSGLTHAYVLTHQGLEHFSDASHSDRGLGLSRTPTIRYYQANLGAGGYLFMTSTPPPTWTEDLLFESGYPNLTQLRRRLFNQAPATFTVGLIHITPGDGHIQMVQAALPAEPAALDQPEVEAPPAVETKDPGEVTTDQDLLTGEDASDTREIKTQAIPDQPAEEENDQTSSEEKQTDTPQEETDTKPGRTHTPIFPTHISSSEAQGSPQSTPEPARQHPRSQISPKTSGREAFSQQAAELREKSLNSLAAFFNGWRQTRKSIQTFFTTKATRWLPGTGETQRELSRKSLILIAVIVPLVVVSIAVGVYFIRGRAYQFQYYHAQAEAAAQNARLAGDPAEAREEWQAAVAYLNQAASYRNTEEIALLRWEAESALDRLDGVVRLAFHPAITEALPVEIQISRIISFGPDLYLLDSAGGRVIHATRGTQLYQINPEFVCAAGNFSGGRIEAIVDMVSLPINNAYQAHLLAVDAVGNVAFCAPGQPPVVQSLPPAGGNVGEIIRAAFAGNLLYVLDPVASAVRVFQHTNWQFLEDPTNFLETVEPSNRPDIGQSVDLAVAGVDLVFLQANGRMVDCSYSGLPANPVICERPPLVDGRPDREDQNVALPEADFVSVIYTTPPDPTISILDGHTADIYRFSLQFRLNRRLRPDFGDHEIKLPNATAFTIGIDRAAFIAFGHQVFFTNIN